jgi:cell division protein FtsI (penicillin-binding protein 3)
MRQMMEGVVLRGTGRGLANLKGYTSGGKTGSAQIYDAKAHIYTHNYNASFLGFAPVANPQIVIAVTLNHTTSGGDGYGGPVARRFSAEVAMMRLRMLDVPERSLSGGHTKLARLIQRFLSKGGLCSPSLDNDLYPPSLRRRFRAPQLRLKLPHRISGLFNQESQPGLDRQCPNKPGGRAHAGFHRKVIARFVLEESMAAGFPVETHGEGWRVARIASGTPSRPHARCSGSIRAMKLSGAACVGSAPRDSRSGSRQ